MPSETAPHDPRQPRKPWAGSKVVLGVCGGIAAYKVIQVARDLTLLGAAVDVVLTQAAQKFVTPLSFEGVTGRTPLSDLFSAEGAALHVALGQGADCVCVAPATADFIARSSQGRADDLLTTTLLATSAPVVLAPAMNDRMYAHPQTQRNLDHAREVLGYEVVGPVPGRLAVGEGQGPGRLIDPAEIVEAVGRALGRGGALDGKKVLVTAGPTREPIDAVRYVGNRSSGRMGYALARAAWRRGAHVTLVSGPTALECPVGVERLVIETAQEMRATVGERIGSADVSIFAAAVSDYRPVDPRAEKIKKSAAGKSLSLNLEENPDVAAETRSLAKDGALRIGFALESSDLLANAQSKLDSKGFDLVVANPTGQVGAGFDVPTNQVTLLHRDRDPEALPLLSKDQTADEILDRVEALL